MTAARVGAEVGVCLLEQRFAASQPECYIPEPSQGLAQHSLLIYKFLFFFFNVFSLQILFVIKMHIVSGLD